MVDNKFSQEEIKNSKRIFKSSTPKGGIDWYIKWVSSIIILTAITIRSAGVPELMWVDMLLSWIGACGWFVVSWIWKDRALILLNGVMGIVLFSGLIRYFYG
tara:strand:- start:63 stop:368 length:306 start_codon:yes stop_codon:yes gene_type:complete